MESPRKCVNYSTCEGSIWAEADRPHTELCVFCFMTKYNDEFNKFINTISIRNPEAKTKIKPFKRKTK